MTAAPAGGGEVPARIEWLADRVQKWLDNLDGDTQTPGGSMCEAVDILADHGESIVAAIRAPQGTPAGGDGELLAVRTMDDLRNAAAGADYYFRPVQMRPQDAREILARLASTGSAPNLDAMVDRFLAWRLPDDFAAKELSKKDGAAVCDLPDVYARLADHCYRMADAMLAARALSNISASHENIEGASHG